MYGTVRYEKTELGVALAEHWRARRASRKKKDCFGMHRV